MVALRGAVPSAQVSLHLSLMLTRMLLWKKRTGVRQKMRDVSEPLYSNSNREWDASTERLKMEPSNPLEDIHRKVKKDKR
jgi:hypothetical protein